MTVEVVSKEMEYPSLSEIKASIPSDCFKASLPMSLYYVLRSVILILVSAYLCTTLLLESSEFYLSNNVLRYIGWSVYWFFQGTFLWGVFVLGHDCGHASFSRYPLVNQIFGIFLHTILMVPYESWKTTHRIHHKNTGNIDKDEIFYPHRENSTDNMIKRLVVPSGGFAWGLYLYGKRHFSVYESIYKGHRADVTVSLAAWCVWAAAVVWACKSYGLLLVTQLYFVPLFVFASWLVLTTFLHHQDVDAPWFGNSQWTYVKGNLSSIDRSYTPILNNLVHSIGTHQIHHLFPKIPHYKLDEATIHFRKAYPHLVRKTDELAIPAFLRNWWVYMRYAVAPVGVEKFTYRDAMKQSYNVKKSK